MSLAASTSKVQLVLHDDDDGASDGEADELVVARLAGTNPVPETPRASPGNVDSWTAAVPAVEVCEDGYAGDALVGSVVSCIDVNGQRTNAKVILYMDDGNYMLRCVDNSMQFCLQLDPALRSRECWIVSKGP